MVDRKGVTAMEYGVIAAGIVLVVATAGPPRSGDERFRPIHRRAGER